MNSLVSCVMPTANRHKYVWEAIKCFNAQTYGNRELIILDDGEEPLLKDIPKSITVWFSKNTRYVWMGHNRKSIGFKRNVVNSIANGKYIAHWDDDDWCDPKRLEVSIPHLDSGLHKVFGFGSALFYNHFDDEAYRWRAVAGIVVGATLVYYKEVWEKSKFNEMVVNGSDNQFVSANKKLVKTIPGDDLFVAHTHKGSTNIRNFMHGYYKVHREELPAKFLESLKLLKMDKQSPVTSVETQHA